MQHAPAPAPSRRAISSGWIAVLLAAILAMVALPVLWGPRESSDLLALYLAADAFASGDAIYPARTELFTMRPPADWAALAADIGWDAPLYPYIYPPLWAALLSGPVSAVGFGTFEAVASLLNPVLLLASGVLVWRAVRPPLPLWLFVGIGQIIAYATTIGSIALLQNQPQILVAFLTILAVERSRNGAPLVGGAVLALAASIKLYPALYLVIWLAAGERRAVASFAVAGAALASASILVAGWPLHREFIDLISGISRTALVLPLSFGLDARIAELQGGGRTIMALMPGGMEAQTGWGSMAKGPAWVMASRIALLGALLTIALAAWRCPPSRRAEAVWPVAMIVLSLLSPLGWSYHFILPALWAPLFLTLPHGRGLALCLLIFTPLSFGFLAMLDSLSVFATLSGALGTAAMTGLAAGLWYRR